MGLLLIVLFAVVISGGTCKKILILQPVYAGSHEYSLSIMAEHLNDRGHDVTLYRYSNIFKPDFESDKLTVRNLRVNMSQYNHPYFTEEGVASPPINLLWTLDSNFLNCQFEMLTILDVHCGTMLDTPSLLATLHRERYDLAIVDLLWNECSLAITHKLKIPTIGVWFMPPVAGPAVFQGIQELPSSVPMLMSGLPGKMNFWERVKNFIVYLQYRFIFEGYLWCSNFYLHKYSPDSPRVQTLLANVSLLFTNNHVSVAHARPSTANVIPLGCLTCKPSKPLTGVFKRFTNSSEDVILVSFGMTGFNSSAVPKYMVNVLREVFSKLDYKFIVKFDPNHFEGLNNVLAVDFLPQLDILGHHRTVLFISHCGINSVMESIYKKVPLLCVPIFLDQGDNAARVKEIGAGEYLNKKKLSHHTLKAKIEHMLTPGHYIRYKSRLERLLSIWNDEPMSAGQKVVHWAEMVMKYGDLSYMKMGNATLNVFQYYSLDVIAFLIAFTVILIYAAKKLWVIPSYFYEKKSKVE